MADKELGSDPVSGVPIYLRNGPYGPYVQIGTPETKKPKRASLPKGTSAASLDLEAALGLLSLPRDIEPHPESGDMIQAGIGRFGPYLKDQGKFTSLPPKMTFLNLALIVPLSCWLKLPNKLVGFLASTRLAARYLSRKVGLDPMLNTINCALPWARRMI